MKIKATCVRCGKAVNGLADVYCSSCQRDVSQGVLGAEQEARPRSGKLLGLLLILLLLGGAGVGYFKFRDQLLPAGAKLMPSGPVALPETPQSKPTMTETLLAEKIKQQEASESGGPHPQRPGAVEPDVPEAGAGPSYGAPPSSTPDPAVAQSASQAPQQTPDHGAPALMGGAAPAENATPQLSGFPAKENRAESADSVWVYYADKEGRDIAAVEQLKSQGQANAAAKGRWSTKNKVNYIFFREENQDELEALKKKFGELEFIAFPSEGPQTSRNLKNAFKENPSLKFLVIVQ